MEYLFSQQEVIDVLIKKCMVNVFRNRKIVVLIGGCSRSGKSTLANKLIESRNGKQTDSLVLSLDNWLKGIDERTPTDTVRERYNYNKIVKDIKSILEGKQTLIPKYDSFSRKTIYDGENIYFKGDFFIIEGTIALDIPELRKISDLNIYVDIDDRLRTNRLKEFYINFKKLKPREANKIIKSREKEETPLIKETRKYADYIFKV